MALLDNSHVQKSSDGSPVRNTFNHAKIAVEVAHEILANSKDNKELCKILNHFTINGEDQDLIKALEFLVEEIVEEEPIKRDKVVQRALTKFQAAIKRLDKLPKNNLTPSKVDKLRDRTKQIAIDGAKESEAIVATKPKAQPRQQRKPAARKTKRYISDRFVYLKCVIVYYTNVTIQ